MIGNSLCRLWWIWISLFFTGNLLAHTLEPSRKETISTVQVNVSDPNFMIELKANPTTGYHWLLGNYNPVLIEPIKRVYEAGDTRRIGSGGEERWFFKLNPQAFVVPHVLTIEMIYARPWDLKKPAGVSVFKITTHSEGFVKQ